MRHVESLESRRLLSAAPVTSGADYHSVFGGTLDVGNVSIHDLGVNPASLGPLAISTSTSASTGTGPRAGSIFGGTLDVGNVSIHDLDPNLGSLGPLAVPTSTSASTGTDLRLGSTFGNALGDVNMDGVVSGTDYIALDTFLGTGGLGALTGDTHIDGGSLFVTSALPITSSYQAPVLGSSVPITGSTTGGGIDGVVVSTTTGGMVTGSDYNVIDGNLGLGESNPPPSN